MERTLNKTNRDLKNLAYEILREKLINCEYKPGTMLNETQLSEDLGFSRTPIRQALNRIEQEGFIRILPKKGIYVTDVSLNDVRQIFQARLEIEPVALKMAGPYLPEEELLNFHRKFLGEDPLVRADFRLDTAMHLFIIEHCGNRFIIDMMRKIFDINTRIIISTRQHETKIHDACKEHLEVLDLLLARDFTKAHQAMYRHIESCKNAALDFFYNMRSYRSEATDTYKTHLKKSESLMQREAPVDSSLS
jgi:DNA-binding GntR family transcriptional regulator